MMRIVLSVAAIGLFVGMNAVMAGEADELRARAGQLKRNAAEFKERGESAVAQKLIQEAIELTQRAEVLEQMEKRDSLRSPAEFRERPLQQLHARLNELRVANRQLWASDAPEEELVAIRTQIRKLEALIAEKEGPSSPEDMLRHAERMLDRIDHLRHAANHLQAADMPDMADKLREQARHMERATQAMLEQLERQIDTAATPTPLPAPPAPQPPSSAEAVERALRAEVLELRREIEKLREQRKP